MQATLTPFVYQGNSYNPLSFWPNQHAKIKSVKNTSYVEISVAHTDRNGATPFIILQPRQSTTVAGLEVEGSWTAQTSGSILSQPSGVSVDVEWTR
jgi:hypothetical protein